MIKEQQKRFVDEHLKLRCKNATQAAKNAGYSEKTASSQASQLLNNPKVQEYLNERKTRLFSELRQEFLFDALEAREKMHEIMHGEDVTDRDKITVCRDFLDRAGFKPDEKVNVEGDMDFKIKVDYGDADDVG